MIEISAEEYNALVAKKKPSKYRNEKTEVDGVLFDSKKEARRYGELKLMEQAGQIEDLTIQPKFPIVHNGVLITTYVADFSYYDLIHHRDVIEDVKSDPTKTPVYRIKKKLVLAFHGVNIQEV